MAENYLAPNHAELIHASGISDAVREARGYRTIRTKAELKVKGFSQVQQIVPALLVPIYGVTGELASYQSRADEPRVKDGRTLKYETPSGRTTLIDVPRPALPGLGNPNIPLLITEGARKADSAVSHGLCCVALLGVSSWRGKNPLGGTVALADWETVALKGRKVYLAFDSDLAEKREVYHALKRLKAFLESRKANVRIIYLPPGANGEKQGLDDYLAAGHDIQELFALASTELRPAPATGDDDDGPGHPYRATKSGILWLRPTADGPVEVRLTNFTATVARDVIEDDGLEQRHQFEVEGRLNGKTARKLVPAAQFNALSWVPDLLGPAAIIQPGTTVRDHARAAVQYLSSEIPQAHVFTHTGWRQLEDGRWIYLHAAGAIGAAGAVEGVEVHLPAALTRFVLPEPPSGEAERTAVQASYDLLELGPERLTIPALAAVYRAAQGSADLGIHLAGSTGKGKSELAAALQQHFGAGMDRLHLPANWESTANYLEGLAFHAKDALLVVDDFNPRGSQIERQRLNGAADRLFRSQGNSSGRGRADVTGAPRSGRPPRGLVLSTGEEVPEGHSLRARTVILEVQPGDLDGLGLKVGDSGYRAEHPRLDSVQEAASAGIYAQALAGFLRWLAGRMEDLSELATARVAELRRKVTVGHARTSTNAAQLMVGLDFFLEYAEAIGAITDRRARCDEAWRVLLEVAAAQEEHHRASEPTSRFLELLSAALASGKAHIANSAGEAPESSQAWGWRSRVIGFGENEIRWEPQGSRVGWLAGENLYLEPEAAYAAVQLMGQHVGVGVSSKTLTKRLHERGLLASTSAGHLTVRRSLEGVEERRVLHLHTHALTEDASMASETGRSGWSGRKDPSPSSSPPDSSARFPSDEEKTGRENRPGAGDGRVEGGQSPPDPPGSPDSSTDRREDDQGVGDTPTEGSSNGQGPQLTRLSALDEEKAQRGELRQAERAKCVCGWLNSKQFPDGTYWCFQCEQAYRREVTA